MFHGCVEDEEDIYHNADACGGAEAEAPHDDANSVTVAEDMEVDIHYGVPLDTSEHVVIRLKTFLD